MRLSNIFAQANPSMVSGNYCEKGTKCCFVYTLSVFVGCSVSFCRMLKQTTGPRGVEMQNVALISVGFCLFAVFTHSYLIQMRGNNTVGFH